jgi:hypothetical protein
MSDEILWVNTPIRGERAIAEFLAVKRYLGIGTNTDVVRMLVREKARQIGQVHVAPKPPLHEALASTLGQEDGCE